MGGAMKRLELLGVIGLCVWSGSGWLLAEAWPRELEASLAQALDFGLIAVVALLMLLWRGRVGIRWPIRRELEIALVGVMLFAMPTLGLGFARTGMTSFAEVAVFTAIPLVMAVLAGLGEEAASEVGLGQAILPGLVGFCGALLLFPLRVAGSTRHEIAFAAVVGCAVLVGWASLRIRVVLDGADWARVAAIIAGANAVVFAAAWLVGGGALPGVREVGVELVRGAVFDLPLVLGTVWLMGRVEPERLGARFLLAPLVTVLEGYVRERGMLDFRTVAAVGLLAVGGVWVMVKQKAVGSVTIRLE